MGFKKKPVFCSQNANCDFGGTIPCCPAMENDQLCKLIFTVDGIYTIPCKSKFIGGSIRGVCGMGYA